MGCESSKGVEPPRAAGRPSGVKRSSTMYTDGSLIDTKSPQRSFRKGSKGKVTQGVMIVRRMLREGLEDSKEQMKDPDFKARCMYASFQLQQHNPEPMRKLTEGQLKRQEKLHRRTLSKLWDFYDVNGDGVLSKEENKQFMRDYFDGTYSIYKEVMTDMVMEATRITMSTLKQQGLSHDAAEELFESVVPIIKKEVPGIVNDILNRWDNEENFGKILIDMDSDHNGKVDKNEFLDKFIRAAEHVLNSTALAKEVSERIHKIIAARRL